MSMLALHNGESISKENLLVHIYDPSLFADFRIYETLKVEKGKALFLEDHMERLFNSARIIDLNIGYDPKIIKQWVVEVVRINEMKDSVLRIVIHGDTDNNLRGQIYIYPTTLSHPSEKDKEEGLKLVTFEGERIYPQAKTMSRLTQFKAIKYAEKHSAFEAILVSNDQVYEGARSSLFLVKDGKIITSELREILPGTRRKYAIQVAKEAGFEVEERKVKKEELYNADEAFVTSATMEIMPVGQIDDCVLPAEKIISKELYKLFQDFKEKNG